MSEPEERGPVYVTPSETIELLRSHGIRLRKGLGQHFLVDNNIVLKILDAAHLEPDDVVLEVGPGIGVLTRGLADRARTVAAVEIDERMAEMFAENVTADNVVLIRGDALGLTRSGLERHAPPPTKFVSNLPYNLAVPILFHVLDEFPRLSRVVVMVQREIADRMTAAPGTKSYGAVTVKLAFYGGVRKLFAVPPSVFVPPPRVESAVVLLQPGRPPAEKARLFELVEAAFSQRRKKMMNSLAASYESLFEKREIGKAMSAAGLSPDVRAEEVAPEEFRLLASSLFADV